MRSTLLFAGAALAVLLTSSCCPTMTVGGFTTLENRRDLYSPQRVNGPYTRMLHNGIPRVTRTTVVTSTTTVSSDGKTVISQ